MVITLYPGQAAEEVEKKVTIELTSEVDAELERRTVRQAWTLALDAEADRHLAGLEEVTVLCQRAIQKARSANADHAASVMDQTLADETGVQTTPEVVLLTKNELVYRGRIDDRYSLGGKRRDEPRTRDLQNAIDAVLAGKLPAVRETKPFGCPLPKRRVQPAH